MKDENIEIRKVYIWEEKMLDNTCITISGNLVNKSKSFDWEVGKIFNYEIKLERVVSVSNKDNIIALLKVSKNSISNCKLWQNFQGY